MPDQQPPHPPLIDETRKRPFWQRLGALRSFVSYEQGVRLLCEHGQLELAWIADDCLRVRLKSAPGEFGAPASYAVHKNDWPLVSLDIDDSPTALTLRSTALRCVINKQDTTLTLETPDGQVICRDAAGIHYHSDGTVALNMALRPEEASYGMGERASTLNLRGKRLKNWNTDSVDYERDSDPLYYCVPFYLGVHDSAAYGLFWDNSFRGLTDIGHTSADELRFESEGGELRYYLFAATDPRRILARYTELTGRIALPPLWALGYQQCRFSYLTQAEVLQIAQQFRQLNIPCDVLYLDIHYMDGFRIFTWDKTNFPDLENMVADLHADGFRVVAILDPGTKIDPQYAAYQSGSERDVFLKNPAGERVSGVVWPGECHFPDFTHPITRDWWRQHCGHLLQTGIDGLWNDMCEPVIFGADGVGTLPDNTRHHGDGRAGTHLEYHNLYGTLMGRSSAEALAEQRPDKRPFNIIRAGWAGAQRYASTWTGDNKSDWDHLKLSIPMVINMGLSGAPFTGPDIGGFRNDGEAELFTRWMQAACLMPFFRSHSNLGTTQQEPWVFGQPYTDINRAAIQLRYQLMPYLYSVVAQSSEYGWPIIRPLWMAEPDNPALRGVDDCYLLGDALLVAPVLEKDSVLRHVYLPQGTWYDFWTNQPFGGGQQITVQAPLPRLPLFVRAGTALPLWPTMPYIDLNAVKTLTLRVYPGQFETVLYEDAGEGLAYRQGDYRWLYISCEADDTRIVINHRSAGRFKPPYSAVKVEVIVGDAEPGDVRVDRRAAPVWFFDDGLLDFTVDTFSNAEITLVRHPADPTILRGKR
ncbi:MAG: DUF4968 domain-containing protein [Chloroflexi bacterium]|nr:DUF4968 domain-containing protein [Chloroflexota bacterium]